MSKTRHKEIERKFLVRGEPWQGMGGTLIRQAYLMRSEEKILRIRQKGNDFYLTLKIGAGMTRFEFEQKIDDIQGEALLNLHALETPIQKMRYAIKHGAHIWDVDVFYAENSGLVMAEIELESEEEAFELPEWAAVEVTGDDRFQNSYLAQKAFKNWQ
ncbi:CYTH domain-containing protein [Temperatibacter marinus]|uniref:CYTH domain-containing protein n=1 Tax=Temperatibacter marinus TaxID=1456591 RepID=A0AA52EHC3_9PROT|nr:CYTH domain-containing protein [Temperatibacter marinus]WND02524.1 CYTH domain-containing protein [Temperatibacter marinus]